MPSAPRKAGRFQSGTTLAGGRCRRVPAHHAGDELGRGIALTQLDEGPPAPPAPGRRPGRQGIVPGGRPASAALPGTGGPSRRRPIRSSARSQPDMPGHSFLCRSISIDAGESKKFPSSSKIFSQGETSPGDTGFHSPQIQVQDLGDLLVGESGQLPHDQHLAVVIREGRPAPAPGPGGALSAPPPPGAGAAGPPPGRDRFPRRPVRGRAPWTGSASSESADGPGTGWWPGGRARWQSCSP